MLSRTAVVRLAATLIAAGLALGAAACSPAAEPSPGGSTAMNPTTGSGSAGGPAAPGNASAEELMGSALEEAEALMEAFPGTWTGREGTPYAARDYRDGLVPQRCAGPQEDVFQFRLALFGPAQDSAEEALAVAEAFLVERGYTLLDGAGIGPDGQASTTGLRDDGRRAALTAGPAGIRYQLAGECSTHASLAGLLEDRLEGS
ncbi:hypothetical protein ACQ3I4_13340 [Zafaria sp. Z1313]|uniref:hypothetical protein n=1 Tax=unclassified Zafaria TaxID=2828765 RepID=UPI002E76B33C|nr:hypothetical protein [Zafaria sp. J156]MEE1621446.1 hypothetical protein [Zafaria sp. J156]